MLDLGSGAGLDCFVLSRLVGETGRVVGVDMTKEQVLAPTHPPTHTHTHTHTQTHYITQHPNTQVCSVAIGISLF